MVIEFLNVAFFKVEYLIRTYLIVKFFYFESVRLKALRKWSFVCNAVIEARIKLNYETRLEMLHSMHYESVFNINEIRSDAIDSMERGAVTSDYPLDVKMACQILNEALASEILCVLRYRHHQVIAKGINFPQVAAEFKEHAMNEEVHMMKLAERIDQLGGDPDMNPFHVSTRSATQYGSSKDLVTMIREDLVAERIAIEVYRKMIDWFAADTTTRRLLEEILADEEEHASDLADLLAAVDLQNKYKAPTNNLPGAYYD